MKIRRDVASLPSRTANETWSAIVKLITGAGSVDVAQLEAARSVVCSAIADEHAASVPIVVKGSSRLVIYTVHGAAAMELGLSIDNLTWNPTASEAWTMTVPCSEEDVSWMAKALNERALRITVRDVKKKADAELEQVTKSADVEIDWTALERT